ncbi:PAS domain-containing serine/threonine-protein kinase isoform X3 [Parasteatoda tepidariorum]|uniref:PAS domain-containing serine/threonine-protein kinase isoform X3 n=1 Tax=Parasteatoda tepidariorum TaxID=114398 RepID=UPI001C722768|nr:PAS domain-containing serine/threonine-protein kinase isoform X3 [Parasteatoda tepidariorum]
MAPLQCRVLEPSTKSCSRLTKAYYHSPLEAESIRHQRAKEFGLSPHPTDSFLHNQSFPGVRTAPENGNQCFDMGNVHRCSIDKFRGDDINSISFSIPKYRQHESDTLKNKHFDGSWMLYKYILNTSVSLKKNLHSFLHNPSKAVLTIDARTTQILTANHRAFTLLGLDEINAFKLKDFLLSSDDQNLFSEADLKPNGEIVLFSGKVMNLVTNIKETVPVSVWARQISTASEFRCLVIMEPVERLMGTVKFDLTGTIFDCDVSFANLYGYETSDQVLNSNIKEFIPSLELEWENQQEGVISESCLKICTTGKTKDNFKFPLNINIKHCSVDESLESFSGDQLRSELPAYEGTVSVFSTISGMITILPNGSIHSCNTNFSMMLFGYAQSELVGEDISVLIPTFYDDIEYLDTNSVALPPFDDDDDSNAKCCNSDGRTTADSFVPDPPRPINPLGRPLNDEDIDLAFSPLSRNSLSSGHSLNFEDFQDSDNIKLPVGSSNLSSTDHSSNNEDSPDKNFKQSSLHSTFEDSANCDMVKNEEQSTSSHGNSSRQMSCSESQDTIHSGTNSFAESDINANVLEFSDGKDSPDCSIVLTKAVCSDREEEGDSFDSESDDSKSGHSESESESYDSEDDVCSESELRKDVSFDDKKIHSPFPCDCKYENTHALEKHSSDCVNSRAFSMKVSTPIHNSQNSKSSHDLSNQSIPDGVYIGIGRHKEGTDLAIEYCVKKVILDTGKFLYCIWVSRDPEEIKEGSPVNKTNSSHFESSGTSQSGTEESGSSVNSSMLLEKDYIAGPFSEHYTVVQHLGKGAFGCIKKAYRKIDGLLVIAKFIRKSEVYKDAWVFDNKLNKRVPLEISLLTTIEHPNIVKVVDVFENDQCFHMIMEKHGSGMDLFEFIERNPKMDEALASYIFRQMVSAVSYLHDLNILHRDIKDENAIIDEKFNVKLIDFGSAAFMGDDLFSVFCGTTEYCSPEVLKGEKYRGPELEMFSLGVTLFTLVLGQNPFVGADEILKGEYTVDREISESLSGLIKHLLEPDPKKRCTLSVLENHPWINQPILIADYKFSEVVTASEDELYPVKYITFSESENDYDESNSIDSDLSNLMKGASIKMNDLSNSLSESGDSFS